MCIMNLLCGIHCCPLYCRGACFSCVSSPLLSQWSEMANVLFLTCILLYFGQSYIKLSHQLQLFHGAETVETLWGCILDSESSCWKSAGLMNISTPKRGFGSKTHSNSPLHLLLCLFSSSYVCPLC